MLDRRLQLLLDQDRYDKVARLARARGISVGAVLRSAIDNLPTNIERREAAIAAILAADPVRLPDDPGELRLELEEAHLSP